MNANVNRNVFENIASVPTKKADTATQNNQKQANNAKTNNEKPPGKDKKKEDGCIIY